jgi:uncharacterized protein
MSKTGSSCSPSIALFPARVSKSHPWFATPHPEHSMSRIEIAKQYIHAAQTGNQALLASLVSPDVVWHQPGDNRFSGQHRGLPAVGAMLGNMMEVSKGSFSITRADHFMENGDWVAICIEFKGEREGARLAQPGVDLLRIEAGKIVEVRLFSSNQEEEDAFWGR